MTEDKFLELARAGKEVTLHAIHRAPWVYQLLIDGQSLDKTFNEPEQAHAFGRENGLDPFHWAASYKSFGPYADEEE